MGLHPDRTWTFLTHAVMHTDWVHLGTNVMILEVAGPFVEKHFRRPFYLLGIILITITGAHLTAKMAPEDWNTGPNPVGMSISTHAIMAAGMYLGFQSFIDDRSSPGSREERARGKPRRQLPIPPTGQKEE